MLCLRQPILLLLALLVGAPASGAPLRKRWSVRLESPTGARLDLAAAGPHLFVDGFDHLAVIELASGRRRRRIASECRNLLADLRVHAAGKVLLALCVERRSEEESFRLARGPEKTVLRAHDLASGRVLWERAGTIAAPVAESGALVLLADRGHLIALDARTGKVVWQVAVPGPASGPTASQAVTVLPTDSGVQARDTATGKQLWTRSLPGETHCAATLGPRHVYLPRNVTRHGQSAKGLLVALDLASGKTVWQHELAGESIFFPAVLGGERLFLAGTHGASKPAGLYAFAATTGKQVWRHPIDTDANGGDFTPTLFADQVLLWSGSLDALRRRGVSTSYSLIGVEAASGALRFRHPAPASEKSVLSRPLVVRRVLYFSDGSRLHAVEVPLAPRPPARGLAPVLH